MSTRNDASAVDLLAELVERMAANECAAEARHAELLKVAAEVADSASCASLAASEVSDRLGRLLDAE